jgi:hypothetical protein
VHLLFIKNTAIIKSVIIYIEGKILHNITLSRAKQKKSYYNIYTLTGFGAELFTVISLVTSAAFFCVTAAAIEGDAERDAMAVTPSRLLSLLGGRELLEFVSSRISCKLIILLYKYKLIEIIFYVHRGY